MRKVGISLLLIGTLILGWTLGVSAVRDTETLIVGIHNDAETLDPANHRKRETETIIRNMMDGFVTRTSDMEVVPELAESLTQIDETTWEIKLRKGVTFHDGHPFTAEDAAFTINRLVKEGAMGGRTSPRKGLLGPVNGATVVDEYTIRVTMDSPWPIFLAMLPFQEVVPKHYLEEAGDEYFAEHPIGTGPFKFVEWEKGSHVVMERYEDYYGGSPDIPPVGVAPLKRVIFQVMPEDASRIAALKAGEIDIMTKVPPHAIKTIEADPNLEIRTANGTRSYFIEMNVNKPPFDDVRVRQAMNYAIDMEAIIETMLGGTATQIPTILSPQAFGYNPDLKPYPYDPEKAKELLAEAGYPNGFEVEIDCEDYVKEVAQAYAMMLEQVGVRAKVRVWEWGNLKAELDKGSRLMWLGDWGNGSLDPAGIMIPKLRTGDRGNFSGYSNPEVDALLDLSNSTLNQEERAEAFRKAQEYIYEDAPMVFGYVMHEIYGVNKRVKNWVPSSDGRINLHDTYIEP